MIGAVVKRCCCWRMSPAEEILEAQCVGAVGGGGWVMWGHLLDGSECMDLLEILLGKIRFGEEGANAVGHLFLERQDGRVVTGGWVPARRGDKWGLLDLGPWCRGEEVGRL